MGSTLVAIVAGVLLFFFGEAFADSPLACDPREQYEVCAIRIQRNSSQDEMASIDAQRRRALDRIEAINAWWASYLDGLEAQRKAVAAEANERIARAAEAAKVRAR